MGGVGTTRKLCCNLERKTRTVNSFPSCSMSTGPTADLRGLSATTGGLSECRSLVALQDAPGIVGGFGIRFLGRWTPQTQPTAVTIRRKSERALDSAGPVQAYNSQRMDWVLRHAAEYFRCLPRESAAGQTQSSSSFKRLRKLYDSLKYVKFYVRFHGTERLHRSQFWNRVLNVRRFFLYLLKLPPNRGQSRSK